MAKKSMRGNVGAVIAGGVAIAAVAGLWYWWWVWYQEQKAPEGESLADLRKKAHGQTAALVAAPQPLPHPDPDDDPDLAVAGADTGGVGFWGDPLPKPAEIGS